MGIEEGVAAWLYAAGASAAVAAAVGYVVQAIIVNVALGALSKALTPAARNYVPPINVTVRNTDENRRLIFGTARVGGTVAYYDISGTNHEYLYYIVVFSGHQVSAIKDIWIDKERISASEIDGSTGAVTHGRFTGYLNIWKHLGTDGQTVDATLNGVWVFWDTNHRLRGCSYIVVRMLSSQSAFPNGAPQDITALVDGALLYDPRLDSTNGGSGTQRASDPSTWAFSRNPALAVRWYLSGGSVTNDTGTRKIMYGLREPDARINDAYTIAAANRCDQTLTGGNTTPGGDQVRYAADVEFSTGETRRVIFETLLAAMSGSMVYVSGKWRIWAGGLDSPVFTITQADLFGDVEVQDNVPGDQRFNAVSGIYRDATNDYVENTSGVRTNSSYETQDGGEQIIKDLDLRAVTDPYRAQRLAEIENRKGRAQRTVKLRGSINLLKVALNETFSLTIPRFGWSGVTYRCIERQFDFGQEAGRVVLTAQIEPSSIWTDMVTAEYSTPYANFVSPTFETPRPPTGLAAVPQLDAVMLTWSPSPTPGVLYSVEQSTSPTMSSPTVIYTGPDTQCYLTRAGTTIYYFRVRATIYGQNSAYEPASGGVQGAASGVTLTLVASASPSSVSISSSSSSQTTGTITASQSGGTPAYTYAWTWLSGGTGLTINSPAAAATTVSATGLSDGETRTGTLRCTVTDSASHTSTVDVPVSVYRTPAMTATASPPSPSVKTANATSITSNAFSVSQSGGTPSISYTWSIVSHTQPTGTPTINTPNASTTTVTTSGTPSNDDYVNVVLKCTVTDSASHTAVSNNVGCTNHHTSTS